MALLNYAKLLSTVLSKIGITSENEDFLKIYFTGDGHLISHGVDYTPDYTISARGLVPASKDANNFLVGNGWRKITISDLPVPESILDIISNNPLNYVLNAKQIIDYVGLNIAASDAMRFKGSIKWTGSGYETTTTSGMTPSFPTSCKIGDTYRIQNLGTFGGYKCSVGDILICIKEGEGEINTTEYWTAVEANIDGQITNTINGIQLSVYSSSTTSFEIYAPKVSGTLGQLLVSLGANTAPTWINLSNIVAGNIPDSVKNELLKSVTFSGNTLTVTVAGTSKSASLDTVIAASVKNALTAGDGILFNTGTDLTYNGSKAITIHAKTGSKDQKGILQVGDNITVSDGIISLTDADIIGALGYTPGDPSELLSYKTVLSTTATGTNTDVSSTGNPYFNLVSSKDVVSGSLHFMGSGISIIGSGTDTNTLIAFLLNEATSDIYGGIKIGYSETSTKRAVKLEGGKAYVDIPTYSVVTKTENGLAPKVDLLLTPTNNSDLFLSASADGSKIGWRNILLAFLDANTWRPINVNSKAFLADSTTTLNIIGLGKTTVTGQALGNLVIESTWRDILIGKNSIGDKALDLETSESIYVATSDKDGLSTVTFGLCWYDLDEETYDYVV